MGLPLVDCRAGTLVWVQRKNGSWWPGRVVETNELSPSSPFHSRAGTPIKLLGRDDATVDWFNVEKSKRIKAFRCGEFDDCIERAESSQANCSKKIVKYARREDAILHALELEKQEVRKKHKAEEEEPVGTICRAKRSRRVYLPSQSNSCWKPTAFLPEPLQVSSSTFEKWECPLQCGSFADDTFSTSMQSDSSESDSRGSDKLQRETQLPDAASLVSTQPSNSLMLDGKLGNMNGKGNQELTHLSNSPPDHETVAELGVPKRELKGKENICNLTRTQTDAIAAKNCAKLKSSYLEDLEIGSHNMEETTLTDVELTVQASYRGERVPLVSLTSRLNGKAIVGHLIDVEALDDGSSEILLPKKQKSGNNFFHKDGIVMLKPTWRTSRRTPVCYLPQPQTIPSLEDDKSAEAYQKSDRSSLKARNSLAPTQEFPRKPLKRPSLSNKKTRTLSSFDTEQRHSGNRLLKTKDRMPSRVTCVPVNQIFSKLLVAVGGMQS